MTYNEDATFWNCKHPLHQVSQNLFNELVEPEGKSKTVEGELLRAGSRIYHDYYNNGFGNNWLGAYNFLDKHLGLTADERTALRQFAKGKIRARKESNYTANDKVAVALEELQERIVNHILSKKGEYTPNSEDMFDYKDRG